MSLFLWFCWGSSPPKMHGPSSGRPIYPNRD